MMTIGKNEIERAFRRIHLLKTLVRKARSLAEAQPVAQRNIDLGIIEADQPTREAREQIKETFNDLQLLLDHLHIAHMAASFELEALPRLGKALGDSRKAIAEARGTNDPWQTKLLRGSKSFEGLHDVEQLLDMNGPDRALFDTIRKARNKFSHGVRLSELPAVDPNVALTLLSIMLMSMK